MNLEALAQWLEEVERGTPMSMQERIGYRMCVGHIRTAHAETKPKDEPPTVLPCAAENGSDPRACWRVRCQVMRRCMKP